jgi:hypothetical protein
LPTVIETLYPEVVLSSLGFKPNDVDLMDLIQEENINKVCNEAFDKLLTQEFNPDQEDFEDDSQVEADCGDE